MLAPTFFAMIAGAFVDGGVFAASPALLGTGLLVGPTADVGFSSDNLVLGGRARVGLAQESDLSWRVQHTEIRVLATGTYRHSIGRGHVGFRFGAGALWLREGRTRHQSDRLASADVEQTTTAYTAGLFSSAGPELRITFVESWMVTVEVGPTIAVFPGDSTPFHFGWAGSIQVGFDFEGA